VAFSVPTTRATGYVVTAANWNSDVVDNAAWLGRDMPHAHVYRTTAQALTTATLTAILFDAEYYDTGACHSIVSNTTRLTVPSGGGGVYSIAGTITYDSNATGGRAAYIRVNGVDYYGTTQVPALNGADTMVTTYDEVLLGAADYVELIGWQSSGGNLNAKSATPATSFKFRWVAAS
jgi:hypothetical protein